MDDRGLDEFTRDHAGDPHDPNAGSQPVQFYRTVTGPPLP